MEKATVLDRCGNCGCTEWREKGFGLIALSNRGDGAVVSLLCEDCYLGLWRAGRGGPLLSDYHPEPKVKT
jgi:hypothetical protein